MTILKTQFGLDPIEINQTFNSQKLLQWIYCKKDQDQIKTQSTQQLMGNQQSKQQKTNLNLNQFLGLNSQPNLDPEYCNVEHPEIRNQSQFNNSETRNQSQFNNPETRNQIKFNKTAIPNFNKQGLNHRKLAKHKSYNFDEAIPIKKVYRSFFNSWVLIDKKPKSYVAVKCDVDPIYLKARTWESYVNQFILKGVQMPAQQKEAFFGHKLHDQRKIVQQYTYPFSSIGYLLMRFRTKFANIIQQKQASGTGALIYPRFVLTCAHNVVYQGKKLIQGLFIPALNGNKGNPIGIKDVFYPKEYVQAQDKAEQRKWDFAVIQLQQSKEVENYGYLGINAAWNPNKKQDILLYGYPGERDKDNEPTVHLKYMYGHAGNLIKWDEEQYWYDHTTGQGQSGSPLIRRLGDNHFQIIGIHTRNDHDVKANAGVRITPTVAKRINQWLGDKVRQQRALVINNQQIDDEKACSYLQANVDKRISEIMISNNNLSKITIQCLHQLPDLYANLADLDISYNNIGDQGFQILCKCMFRRLWKLNLESTGISNASTQGLKKIDSSFEALAYLNLRKNQKISAENRALIRSRLEKKMIGFYI